MWKEGCVLAYSLAVALPRYSAVGTKSNALVNMTEVDSSLTIDVQAVQPTVDRESTLATDNEDSSRNIVMTEVKGDEESVENGNSSNEEDRQTDETTRIIVGTSPPPPPVVNPWNKNTKNARNSTEKGRTRLYGIACYVYLRLTVLSAL